jgi:hypothetical protein
LVDRPPEVLADRDRRMNLAPRSIVAAIAGDPLPFPFRPSNFLGQPSRERA